MLLADDEHLVRAGLRALIQAEPDMSVVGEAGTGAQAVAQARQLRPDVVLMDVRMPERTGIEATAEILATMPDPLRILIVTTFENDEYVYAALREGASGFLLKRARPAEILHAIRLIAQGTTLLYPTAIRDLVRRFGRPPARDALRSARLTDRETTVLRLIAAGLSNAEIGAQLYLGNETVKTHVGNVLTKLHARDRTQAVITAYETGFITPRDRPLPPRSGPGSPGWWLPVTEPRDVALHTAPPTLARANGAEFGTIGSFPGRSRWRLGSPVRLRSGPRP